MVRKFGCGALFYFRVCSPIDLEFSFFRFFRFSVFFLYISPGNDIVEMSYNEIGNVRFYLGKDPNSIQSKERQNDERKANVRTYNILLLSPSVTLL